MRRLAWLSLWLLTTLWALGGCGRVRPSHGLPKPGIPQSIGVNIHFTRTTPKEWRLLVASGVRWVRMDFTWATLQPRASAPPNFRATGFDRLVRRLGAAHMRPIFILDYCNPAFPAVTTAAGRAAFARFAAAAAHHFRAAGVVWEIWNEPDGGFWRCTGQSSALGHAASYAHLAEAASAAIHHADPRATVIGPAAARFDWSWFRQLQADGLLRALQGFSVHGYGANTPEGAQAEWRKLHAFLAAHPVHGHTLPMLSGEWGFPTVHPLPPGWCCTESVQADYLVRMMLDNLQAGTALSIWYDLHDCGASGSADCAYGLLHANLQPKPAYHALRVLTRTLAGQAYVPALDVASCASGVHAIRLARGGEAFWSTGAGPTRGVLYVGAAHPRLVGEYGAAIRPSGSTGVLRVVYHRSVTYVLGASGRRPPPAPAGLARVGSLAQLLTRFYAGTQNGNLNRLGSAAAAAGVPGRLLLQWTPLCGVGSYQVFRAASPHGGVWGLGWRSLGRVRHAIWSGAAPTSPTYYAVAAVSPTGVRGPMSAALRIGGSVGRPTVRRAG